MMYSHYDRVLIGVLLALPALWPALSPAGLEWQWFWPNYLYYAAPHGVVVALSLWSVTRAKPTLVMLLLLNLWLALVYGWVRWAVPSHESGLAWLLYIPGYLLALVLYGIYLVGWQRKVSPRGRAK
jgi:hypothetical protein